MMIIYPINWTYKHTGSDKYQRLLFF